MTTLFLTAGTPKCYGKDCDNDYLAVSHRKMRALMAESARRQAVRTTTRPLIDPAAIYAARREAEKRAATRPLIDPAAIYAARRALSAETPPPCPRNRLPDPESIYAARRAAVAA